MTKEELLITEKLLTASRIKPGQGCIRIDSLAFIKPFLLFLKYEGDKYINLLDKDCVDKAIEELKLVLEHNFEPNITSYTKLYSIWGCSSFQDLKDCVFSVFDTTPFPNKILSNYNRIFRAVLSYSRITLKSETNVVNEGRVATVANIYRRMADYVGLPLIDYPKALPDE